MKTQESSQLCEPGPRRPPLRGASDPASVPAAELRAKRPLVQGALEAATGLVPGTVTTGGEAPSGLVGAIAGESGLTGPRPGGHSPGTHAQT